MFKYFNFSIVVFPIIAFLILSYGFLLGSDFGMNTTLNLIMKDYNLIKK